MFSEWISDSSLVLPRAIGSNDPITRHFDDPHSSFYNKIRVRFLLFHSYFVERDHGLALRRATNAYHNLVQYPYEIMATSYYPSRARRLEYGCR
jgi:hypothetical protein